MNRPGRRTFLGALAGGSLAGVVGVGGWYVLDGDLPAIPSIPPDAGMPSKGLMTETARLGPADRDANDDFGHSVALGERTAVVGAPSDDDPNGTFGGSGSLFEDSMTGWTRRSTLAPVDGDAYDRFGESVALGGDAALVGARGADDPNGENAGAVYAFGRSGDGWAQTGTFAASDGTPGDTFGAAVDVSGSTALVGAPGDDAPNGLYAGSAYVFDRSDGNWSQASKLAAADGDEDDAFGSSVAVAHDCETAVVGAPEGEDANGTAGGAAFVFERRGNGLTQVTKLAASDGDPGDDFGRAVDIAGETVAVGAPRDEGSNGKHSGAVYLFERGKDGWSGADKLTLADGEAGDYFGHSIALADSGDAALFSAKGDAQPNGKGAGAAYVFDRTNDGWARRVKLVAADGNPGDRFGRAVALADGTALVSAPERGVSDGGTADASTVYLFDL